MKTVQHPLCTNPATNVTSLRNMWTHTLTNLITSRARVDLAGAQAQASVVAVQALVVMSIDDDLIDYSPRMAQPTSESDNNEPSPFIYFCEHAKLCSMVVKQLYGITKSRVPRNDVQDLFHSLDTLLQSWKDQSGPSRTNQTFPAPGHRPMQSAQPENNVELFLRGKPCVQSAREVLSQAHLLEPSSTTCSDWLIVQVPIMACCVLLIDVFSKDRSEDFRGNMVFLGMASGWLGRLAAANMDTAYDIAFHKIMELIALAQQQCKL
ncbi:hypothetical protein DHEL01_v208840 [Diaporthe helianthi]|uniref:Uncharacterized protein n=1 Tax=Diaporthe helianthi TaxID=158607 RepID=A0A2P5HR90_DIAHE|nr:hypothetical protein DHEL01_v208840 [Diaporthe helianthi]